MNIHCGDNGISCGPYQIQYGYWSDAGRIRNDWRSCVDDFRCSEATVRGIRYICIYIVVNCVRI